MPKVLKPIHPGEILREEFVGPFGLLALDLRIPVTRISEIVHERRAITPSTALRLARYFGTTPQFWMQASEKISRVIGDISDLSRPQKQPWYRIYCQRYRSRSAARLSYVCGRFWELRQMIKM